MAVIETGKLDLAPAPAPPANQDSLGAQFRAGVQETFGQSPQAVEELGTVAKPIPAALWGIYGIADWALDQLGKIGPAIGLGQGEGLPGGERALQYFSSAVERANEIEDVGDPETFLQNAARFGGGLAVPVGGIANLTTKGATALGLRAGGRLALPAAASRPLSVAGSLALPGIQARTGVGAAAEATVGLTIAETLRQTLTPEPPGTRVVGNDPQDTAEMEGAPTLPTSGSIYDEDTNSLARTVGYGALAFGALVAAPAGYRALRNAKDAASQAATEALSAERVVRNSPPPPPETTIHSRGARTERSTTADVINSVYTQTIERNAPIFRALRQLDDPVYRDIRAQIETTAAPEPMEARINNAFRTGHLPNSTVRVKPISSHYEELGRLTPEQRAMYNDALVAGTKADDMLRFGNPTWGSLTDADLHATLRYVRTNEPEVWRLVNDVWEMNRGMRDYMLERGVINAAEHARMGHEMGHFSPIMEAPNKYTLETLSDRMLTGFGLRPSTMYREILNPRAKVGGVKPGEVMRPEISQIRYMDAVIRSAEINAVRRNALRALEAHGATTSRGRPLVRFLRARRTPSKGPPSDDRLMSHNIVQVLENGQYHVYKVNDPTLTSALQFKPGLTVPIMSTMRKMGQRLTTGRARPDFLPVSLSYEAFTAALTGGRALPLHRAILAPLSGTTRVAGAALMDFGGRRLRHSVANSGLLSTMLGPANADALGQVMERAYRNSARRLLEERGGGTATYYNDGADVHRDLLTDVAPDYVRQVSHGGDIPGISSWWRQIKSARLTQLYTGVLDAMHQAIPVEAMASQVRRKARLDHIRLFGRDVPVLRWEVLDSEKALREYAAEARNITGDPTARGGDVNTVLGQKWQQYTEMLPYGNHALQVFKQYFKAAEKDFDQFALRTATVLSTMWLGVQALVLSNDGAREHYTQVMTPEQRARMLPFYNSDGSMAYVAMVPHEMRVMWSPMVEGMLALGGYTDYDPVSSVARDAMNAYFGDDLLTAGDAALSQVMPAVGEVVPDPFPQPLRAMTAAAGMELPEVTRGRFSPATQRDNRLMNQEENDASRFSYELLMNEVLLGASAPIVDGVNAIYASKHSGRSMKSSAADGVEAASRAFREPARLTGYLFPDRELELRVSTGDPTSRNYNERYKNLRELSKKMPSMFAPDMGRMTIQLGTQPSGTGQELQGTLYGIAVQHAQFALRELNTMIEREKQSLRRMQDRLDIDYAYSDPEVRRAKENDIAERIRALNAQGYQIILEHEAAISNQIGRPFTFQELNLEELRGTKLQIETGSLP